MKFADLFNEKKMKNLSLIRSPLFIKLRYEIVFKLFLPCGHPHIDDGFCSDAHRLLVHSCYMNDGTYPFYDFTYFLLTVPTLSPKLLFRTKFQLDSISHRGVPSCGKYSASLPRCPWQASLLYWH